MTTMNALRAHIRGGAEQLTYEPAPAPEPGPGEVQVQVAAAGITFDELLWDLTWTRDGRDRTPIVPSHEFAGVVSALGDRVTGLSVGDHVYGMVPFDRDGAAADLLVTPANHVARAAASLSSVESAALPLAGLTAWQALTTHAGVARGEAVLVIGGLGGVGAFAIQIARHLGARVTTAIRGGSAELARTLGADTVVDITDGSVPDGPFDVVLDTVGGPGLDDTYGLLRPGGRLVTLQAPPSQEKAAAVGASAAFFVVQPDAEELRTLASLADTGALRVLIAGSYPLSAGRAAYQSGRTMGRAPGKTVLIVQ
jgi:NADPH:quinone reductase-like Zn-dependent oxidoreductase